MKGKIAKTLFLMSISIVVAAMLAAMSYYPIGGAIISLAIIYVMWYLEDAKNKS